MRYWNYVTFVVLATTMAGPAAAQLVPQVAPPAASPAPTTIFVGQSLEAATLVLRERKIAFGEGGFSLAQGDPDRAYLSFALDEDHTRVCVSFSKSTAKITALAMVFFPSQDSQVKSVQSWIPANELTLYADASYAVHFAKPLTADELRRRSENRPRDQRPTSNPNAVRERRP